MSDTLNLVLLIVAAILIVIDLARSRGQSLVAWGALLITAVLLLPRLNLG